MGINRSIHVFGSVAGMLRGHVLYQNNISVVRIIIFIAVVATEQDFDSFSVGSILDIQWVMWSLVFMGCCGTQKVVMWDCDVERLKSLSAHEGLTVLDSYTKWQAHLDFDVSYTVFKRVISGVWQHGGSYYKKVEQEKEDGEDDNNTP